MASSSQIYSDSFDNITDSEINTPSDFLSAVDNEVDSISAEASQTTNASRMTSSIHKHYRLITKQEKTRTKK